MSEQLYKWDKQLGELLSHFHGPVEYRATFKAALLQKLKEKQQAQTDTTGLNTALHEENNTDHDIAQDRNTEQDPYWRALLQASYIPCEPDPQFKHRLFADLQAKQASLIMDPEEQTIKTVLQSYQPVEPSKEFQTRLLDSLKKRQRETTTIVFRAPRRKTVFLSALSSLAAAAAVMAVVWVAPTSSPSSYSMPPASDFIAITNTPPALSRPSEQNTEAIATKRQSNVIPASYEPEERYYQADPSYQIDAIFMEGMLPATMRGIGMEINHGDGWQPMDETMIASVNPGIALRPREAVTTPGLGFGDGSTILMQPDAVIETTDGGIAVRQGTMTVNVPANSSSRFFLHFSERDVAIEPGTMLAVTVEAEDSYAAGGAPAPVVKVLDGGMAVARGKGGIGIMLANQVYSLDRYVTADLPGRPLCSFECEELERAMVPLNPALLASASPYGAAQMVSATDGMGELRPASMNGYTKTGTRWIANSYQNQPTIKIPYLSNEYFSFANTRRDLASALALGSEVILEGGDGVFYEIVR